MKNKIENLAQELCEYAEYYEIIDNPDLEYYTEKDEDYLKFPYAVKFFIERTAKILGSLEDFNLTLFINENEDGLIDYVDGISFDVDLGYIYSRYADRLEEKLYEQKRELEKVKSELNHVKSESAYTISKLENRIMEMGASCGNKLW